MAQIRRGPKPRAQPCEVPVQASDGYGDAPAIGVKTPAFPTLRSGW